MDLFHDFKLSPRVEAADLALAPDMTLGEHFPSLIANAAHLAGLSVNDVAVSGALTASGGALWTARAGRTSAVGYGPCDALSRLCEKLSSAAA